MVYDNGIYREATEEEVNEIKAQNQMILLEELMHDEVTNADLINIILAQYSFTLPSGERKQANEMEGMSIDLPFKLGYKWEKILTPASKAFSYQLVEDHDAIGTEENPIIYSEDVPLLENAYYMVNGVRNVYIGGQFVEF